MYALLFLLVTEAMLAQEFVSDVTKAGTTVGTFLSIAQGPRATAMGGAFVAVADDQNSLYWNPAGIAESKHSGFLFDHTQWFADINFNFIAGSFSLGDYGAAGFSIISSDVKDMDVTTVAEPDGTGETFGYADIAVSLAYAIKLTDHFSIGFNPKYIHQRIWRMNASAFAFDLGMRYDTPFEGIVLGMAITNFGEKMQLRGGNTLILHDPNPDGSGNNDRIPAELSTEEWALPLNFKVGLAYHVLNDQTNKLVLAVDAMHPSDNDESLNIGGEYTLNDFVSLRTGYKSLFLSNTEESFSFGFGIQQYVMGSIILHVDYAYQDFKRLQSIQKFSLGINF